MMSIEPRPSKTAARITPPKVGVSFLVSQVGAHAAASFGERLRKVKLKPYHAGILRMLGANAGITQRALSNLLGIFPSQTVRFLDQLESRQLIERSQLPEDRRSYRLRLTAKGAKALAEIGMLTQELEKDLLANLTSAERDQLRALLERVVAHQNITPGVHPAYKELAKGTKPRR
jgi:DNA-binding MarR family transcriptional regulator